MMDSPELPLVKPNGRAEPSCETNSTPIASAKNAIASYSHNESSDWEWWRDPENQDAIITHQQLATAVYIASREEIRIHREGVGSDDDACVYIRAAHVPALIRKLQHLIKG